MAKSKVFIIKLDTAATNKQIVPALTNTAANFGVDGSIQVQTANHFFNTLKRSFTATSLRYHRRFFDRLRAALHLPPRP